MQRVIMMMQQPACKQFMEAYHYEFNRISSDICMDFERFDEGDDPAAFLSRYLRQVYSKINQGQHHRPWC